MDVMNAGQNTAQLFLELAAVGLELDKIATACYLQRNENESSLHQKQLQESLAVSRGKLDAVGASLINRCVEGTAQHERWNKIIRDMNAKFHATCNFQRAGEIRSTGAASPAGAPLLPSVVHHLNSNSNNTAGMVSSGDLGTANSIASGTSSEARMEATANRHLFRENTTHDPPSLPFPLRAGPTGAAAEEDPKLGSADTGAVLTSSIHRASAEWGGQQSDSAPPQISSHEGTRRGQGADALLRLSGSVDLAQQSHESKDETDGVSPIVAAYDHVAAISEHSARTRPIDPEVLGPRKQPTKTATTTWGRFLAQAQAQAPAPRSEAGADAGRGSLVQFPSPGLKCVEFPGEAPVNS